MEPEGESESHIIFNSVDYVNHRKYHSDKKDKYRIRDINDEICEANNLSVLPRYDGRRKTKYENIHKKAKDTWQSKLKLAIDPAIQDSDTFEDFLYTLEIEGYEIKHGKHISLRAPGQGRFTRAKTIGDNYTEDAIRERIVNKDNEPASKISQPQQDVDTSTENKTSETKIQHQKKKTFSSKRINLLVDIS